MKKIKDFLKSPNGKCLIYMIMFLIIIALANHHNFSAFFGAAVGYIFGSVIVSIQMGEVVEHLKEKYIAEVKEGTERYVEIHKLKMQVISLENRIEHEAKVLKTLEEQRDQLENTVMNYRNK